MQENNLEEKAKLVRKWILVSTTEAGSGHATSSLSAADLGTVLFDKYFSYDLKNPLNFTNDRFVLSKGHASPLLYTLYAVAGAYPLEELKTLRKFGSRLEGHPTPNFPFADAATGSLGQGLSVGCGLSYFQKKGDLAAKTFVLMGDGELAEGQVWEAANFASHYRLDNLIAIVDVNRLGQSQETMFGHHVEEYQKRFAAFGFETVVIDGHNYEEIIAAFEKATNNATGRPFAIIAHTIKGKGVSFLEDKDGWHGKALSKEELDKALGELGAVDESLRFSVKQPPLFEPKGQTLPEPKNTVEVDYKIGDEIATRDVYGKALGELADTNLTIYALDGDVKNSTYSQDFLKIHPERFIECFIAEQNMVSVAVGFSRLGRIPFVSTFAAFFTRAADQIRMAVVSRANIKFVGSHAGVSIGEDGPSQMGLEDIALFGTLPGTVVLHPSDATSAAKLLGRMAEHFGIVYLRTLRVKTPVIYESSEEFVIGGSKTLRSSQNDMLTIVASGITVHEALKAYEALKKENIIVRVIDCYSVKPIDKKTLESAVKETEKPIIITVEDHFEHGGLGDFVQFALTGIQVTVNKLAVAKISRSGTTQELLDDAGISAKHIVEAVKTA